MRMVLSALLLLLGAASATPAYYSWTLGNTADVHTKTKGYTMIQGGGTDMDQAMAWMLEAAGGGDVVVIRDGKEMKEPYKGADAYNPYFFSELNVTVDSVETIFLNSRSVAENPDVVKTIRNAECLFFTGGDQNYYYNYIRGTALQDAIRYLQTVKKVPIGGTSAGCAIQGQYVYTAEEGSVVSSDALRDPYNKDLSFAKNFLATPYLQNVTTDTHYSQRDRHGRHMAFLARVSKDYGVSLPAGIGLDEKTALAIDDKDYGVSLPAGIGLDEKTALAIDDKDYGVSLPAGIGLNEKTALAIDDKDYGVSLPAGIGLDEKTALAIDDKDYGVSLPAGIGLDEKTALAIDDKDYGVSLPAGIGLDEKTALAIDDKDYGVSLPAGIGLDEKTALAIDDKGFGRVFGYGTAYFLIQNTHYDYPETCRRGERLDWYRGLRAVQTYEMAGDVAGSGSFDLVLWRPVSSATPFEYWYVDDGVFGARSFADDPALYVDKIHR